MFAAQNINLNELSDFKISIGGREEKNKKPQGCFKLTLTSQTTENYCTSLRSWSMAAHPVE